MKIYVNQRDRDVFKSLLFEALDAFNPHDPDHTHFREAIEDPAVILHTWGVIGNRELCYINDILEQNETR